ncbi:MAG: hypothetical protein J6S82_01825 [Bacteroidales bacterium]|nr:hypothetical protein [Bacteroidales bacterium]
MKIIQSLLILITLSFFSASLISCTKECDCNCCNQTSKQKEVDSAQNQHAIVGKWLCTSNTFTIKFHGGGYNTQTNTLKGWVAIFGTDGIANVPGDAEQTTYSIIGDTIILGTGTRINVTELSSTTLKYNFSRVVNNGISTSDYCYDCTFSRIK